jgi:hypothetical protein
MAGESKTGGRTEKIRIEQHSISGMVWCGGWLFTLGFLHLPFWKGVLALLIWPYYLGASFSSLV